MNINAGAAILPEQLAQEIESELSQYSKEAAEAVKKAVDEVSAETVEELKRISPKKSGDYAKDWTKKTSYENTRTKRNTVYNKKHYRLTHLLEDGHASRNGGRVPGKVHIATAEKNAKEKLEKQIKSGVENAGRNH